MVDPCWLPSAVMQTIGALYGIFIAVFILMIQFLDNKKDQIPRKKFKQCIEKVVESFIVFFELLTIVIIITEIINGLILLGITSNYPQLDPINHLINGDENSLDHYPTYLLLSLSFFAISISYISVFTYAMLKVLSEISNNSYDFQKQIDISESIKKYLFNRCDFFTFIFIISISAILISMYGIYNIYNSIIIFISLLMLIILSNNLLKNYSIHDKRHLIYYIILMLMIFFSIFFIPSLVNFLIILLRISLIAFIIVFIIVLVIFLIQNQKSSEGLVKYTKYILWIFFILILTVFLLSFIDFLVDVSQILK